MSGDVTTQDLTQGGPAVLVALINEQNLIYLPTPLTVTAATFNDPSSYGGSGANTVITVGTNEPATYGAGTVAVHYTRVDLALLPALQPVLVEATPGSPVLSDVVNAINTAYGLALGQANITQDLAAPLTANGDGSFTQQLSTVSVDMLYTGQQTFTFVQPLPMPVAAFTSSANYLDATFTDTSTDANGTIAAWAWTFGDGGTATTQNPTHTYAADGTYSVVLKITDTDGTSTDTVSHPITVAAIVPTMTAAFTSETEGYTATFTDASTDVNGTLAAWLWDFGDGNTSTAQNPTHAYATTGTKTVKLTVTDANGVTTATVSHLIGISAPVVAASYTKVVSHLSVAFTDTSTDTGGTIASWQWNFGDSQTSTEQNPTHVYNAAGDYTVRLDVTDADGVTTSTYSTTVTSVEAEIYASFYYNVSPGTRSTDFSDTSDSVNSTISAWLWDFGDGNTSTTENPTHVYATNGTYTVTLTVTDADGVSTNTFSNTNVKVSDVTVAPNFTYVATALSVAFTDTTTVTNGTEGSWLWDFGDGNTSTEQNPTHVYAVDSNYSVKLTVTESEGLVGSNIVQDVTTSTSPVDALFYVSNSSLTRTFSDASTSSAGTITAWNWDFGDGGTSTEQNPTHTYASGDAVYVTLTATDSASNTGTSIRYVNPGVNSA